MKISKDTKIGDVVPFLKEEHLKELLEKCEPVELDKPVITMTVGEFIKAADDKYIMSFFNDRNESLVKAVGRVKQFNKEMDNIAKVLKMNEIKPNPEELAAQRGVTFPSFGESILCDCLEWFNLNSLDAAENIPLSNYLIMKRKKSAEALYERNLNKIYSDKNKKPKTGK